MDAGDLFLVPQEDIVAFLGAGATANIVCFRWLPRRNRILERRGIPRVATYSSKRDSALAMGVLRRYTMRRIVQWGSLVMGGCPLRLCWIGTFQRNCEKEPRRHLVGGWIFYAVP